MSAMGTKETKDQSGSQDMSVRMTEKGDSGNHE